MKTIKLLSILMLLQSVAFGGITIRICESDGITPYNQRDVMIGEKLVFIVRSNNTSYGSGGLYVEGLDRDEGVIEGRQGDPTTTDCEGSHTVCAGDTAQVIQWEDSNMAGCELYGSSINSSPGDWFMVDYTAKAEGSVDVRFFNYIDASGWDHSELVATLNQVKTRDFNEDNIVNFFDYSLFENYWLETNCTDPNTCGKYDLDEDSYVNLSDLCMFSEFWLHGAPSTMGPYFDETVRYTLIDEYSNNMVTMDVGDTIRVYLDLETTDVNDISVFNVEVQISDPNNGWIYMSNDPNAPVEMLPEVSATPKIFGSWNPGAHQAEGIEFFAANVGSPMEEGHLASFVYTCTSTETTVLNVLNISSSNTSGEVIYPAVEDFVINPPMAMDGSSGGTTQSAAPPAGMDSAMAEPTTTTAAPKTVASSEPLLENSVTEESTADATTDTSSGNFCDDIYNSLMDMYANSYELQDEYNEEEWDQLVTEITSSCDQPPVN